MRCPHRGCESAQLSYQPASPVSPEDPNTYIYACIVASLSDAQEIALCGCRGKHLCVLASRIVLSPSVPPHPLLSSPVLLHSRNASFLGVLGAYLCNTFCTRAKLAPSCFCKFSLNTLSCASPLSQHCTAAGGVAPAQPVTLPGLYSFAPREWKTTIAGGVALFIKTSSDNIQCRLLDVRSLITPPPPTTLSPFWGSAASVNKLPVRRQLYFRRELRPMRHVTWVRL